MRPFIRLVGIAVIVTCLSAFETASTDKKVEVVQPMTDTAIKQTYADAIHYKGNGSVQVFSQEGRPGARFVVELPHAAGTAALAAQGARR